MQFKPYLLFYSLFIYSCSVHADFQIKTICDVDEKTAEDKGTLHKFYASELAYNSEPPRCLKNEAVLTNHHTKKAVLSNHELTNDVIVSIHLTEHGQSIFADYTNENLQSNIALVVDNKILTLIALAQPITDGVIQIHGLWYEDAIRLSNAINLK